MRWGWGDKWELIKETFAEVNQLFGDLVKVTPSSKVVGDMALYLVSNGLTTVDVLERGDQISFPESVQSLFRGDLGQPVGGFPKKLQSIILKDEQPYEGRPNEHLEPVDLEGEFKAFQEKFGEQTSYTDFLSHQLYPKVYEAYHKHYEQYGNVSKIPTRLFFYGMQPGEEAIIDIARGKSIVIKYQSLGPVDEDGMRTVFFKLNGQTRNIEVRDKSVKVERVQHQKVDKANPKHIGAPLQGLLSKVLVEKEQTVKKNTPLFVIEAMKMETTITASEDTQISAIHLPEGSLVNTDDLVLTLS